MAIAAERAADRLRPRRAPARPVLDAYRGYATSEGLVLRGRVLARLRRTAPEAGQSRWQNLREMASLFFTDEVADVTVIAPETGATAVSDAEGYVTLHVPLPRGDAGWCQVPVEIAGDPASRTLFPAMVPRADARLGVISDIDDTMIQTGAHSLARNLWTTFTGSTLSRRVYSDSIVLMEQLSKQGRNPVWFVSSSPWNLHSFLNRVFARAGLVTGPMFLRDLGIGESQFVTGTGAGHKSGAIDRIMAAAPDLPMILVGDTGQDDAQIYLEACHRHGGRIKAVILRHPDPGADDESRAAMAALRRLGVVVAGGPDFSEVAERLDREGVLG